MGKIQTTILIMVLVLAISGIVKAASEPEDPDTLNIISSERRVEDTIGTGVPAQAGNVTALTVDDLRITENWQGYFGNITGSIVLDDAGGNTLFEWELAEPQGEIYASNTSTVEWNRLRCVNFSDTGDSGVGDNLTVNLTIISNFFTMNTTEKDGLNGTFNTTYTGEFQVGPTTINGQDTWCASNYAFVSDAYQTTDFQTVLLSNNDSLVFASIIEPSDIGFNGAPTDFQMLVLEDGSPGGADSVISTYYFFVELE